MNTRLFSRRIHAVLVASITLLGASMLMGAEEEFSLEAGSTALDVPPPAASSAGAAPVGIAPELLRSIRAATFEVVLRKPQEDPIQYEKPLPLNAIPFAQRNDQYKSIGTAFAIGANRFVTAAHVTSAASGSLSGPPALRDAQGRVHAIERVLQFSLHEDFIVFTVANPPQVVPLSTNTQVEIDSAVIAVGNALGEGIVARDGRLTSQTPEEREGRWKWLRFSAAASPGNSGGPLLDTQGRVIGLIARKSANENLNYAVPIDRVLKAAAGQGEVDSSYAVSLPYMPDSRTLVRLQQRFELPLPFAEFDRRLIALTEQHAESSRQQVLKQQSANVYPRGKSARLLSDTYLTSNPSVITQQPDGNWDVLRNTTVGSSTQLGNDGLVWVHSMSGVMLFRIEYPSELDVTKERGNSRLLSEQLLKGMRLSRTVGSERIRMTSLGDAGKPKDVRDQFGRVWQQWQFPMAFGDTTLMVAALPVPDGYIGIARPAKGYAIEGTAAELRLVMDQMQVSYSGTLPRWRAFLADTRLRPEPFSRWKMALDPAAPIRIELPRIAITENPQVLDLTDESHLSIIPGWLMNGERAEWDALAVQFNLQKRRTAGVAVVRRARPAVDAGPNPTQRWGDMTQLRGQFSGAPVRNANGGFARKVAGAEGVALTDAEFLYDLSYNTTSSVPGEVARAIALLPAMVVVREK